MPAARARIAKRQDGFTIVEAMVALFVFAVAGVALMQMQAQSASTFADVETRALGGVIAQNRLVDAMSLSTPPELGAAEGEETLAGRAWRWRVEIERTGDPATLHLSSSAFAGGNKNAAASLSAYLVVGTPQ